MNARCTWQPACNLIQQKKDEGIPQNMLADCNSQINSSGLKWDTLPHYREINWGRQPNVSLCPLNMYAHIYIYSTYTIYIYIHTCACAYTHVTTHIQHACICVCTYRLIAKKRTMEECSLKAVIKETLVWTGGQKVERTRINELSLSITVRF